MPSRTTMRSTTTSMSCLYFLSSAGASSIAWNVAVDADAREARLLPLRQFLAVLALTAPDDGREEVMPAALGQGHHAIDHLADLLRFDRQAGRGRVGDADARPQQAHVVVDLGDRGDGRARVARWWSSARSRWRARGRRYARRRASASSRGTGARRRDRLLDVAALALGVDGVEGEARLALPDRPVMTVRLSRGISTSIALEVVLARAADRNMGQHRISFVPFMF